MAELSEPYEIKEWNDGETLELTITGYEVGELLIHPRDGRAPKRVDVMRVHVPPQEKTRFPHYWDLTSKRLVAQLKSILPPTVIGPFPVKITAIGTAPMTHYSVSRLPEKPE
jgi:hypothetical protein